MGGGGGRGGVEFLGGHSMFLINLPSGNAKIQKLIAKHIFECLEKRKEEDGKK